MSERIFLNVGGVCVGRLLNLRLKVSITCLFCSNCIFVGMYFFDCGKLVSVMKVFVGIVLFFVSILCLLEIVVLMDGSYVNVYVVSFLRRLVEVLIPVPFRPH